MAKAKRHHVDFTATKKVKEPTEVAFRTKTWKPVDFIAEKPVARKVEVDFMARNKKK
jgi:hypothetical protein